MWAMELTDGQVVAVAGGLCAAIGALWRVVASNMKKTEAKLAQCEEGHAATTVKLLEYGEKLGEVRGEIEGIRGLSGQVLEQIHISHQTVVEDTIRRINQLDPDTRNRFGQLDGGGNLGPGSSEEPT